MSRPNNPPTPGLVIVVGLRREGSSTRATIETRLHASVGEPGTNAGAARKGIPRLPRSGRSAGKDGAPTDDTSRRDVVSIPVFGVIPAGPACEASQELLGCVQIDVETLGMRPTVRTFALLVRGDSMIVRHILDGDIVVIEAGMRPEPGDVVAALIDGESTLKTLVSEGGRAFLRAENPAYPDLIPADELVIQGVMVALIRRGDSPRLRK